MYFRLKPEIYLINGHAQSILTNVLTGEIIILDESETEIIKMIENNESCFDSPMIHELIGIDWIDEADLPVFVDKIRYTNAFNKKRFWKNFPQILVVTIQITNECRNECGDKRCLNSFCPMNLTSSKINEIDYENLKRIIDQLKNYNPSLFILTGGNPLLHKEFQKIYSYVKSTGIKTCVSLCSVNPLNEAERDMPIILTIDDENDFIKHMERNQGHENLDVFINSKINAKTSYKRYADPPLISKDAFRKKTTIDHFFTRMGFDSCLCGKVTVLSNGDLTPCLGMSNETIGNLFEEAVSPVLRKLYNDYWSICVDDWDNECIACAYRYNCYSCRKFTVSNCRYDVEAGVWK